MSEKYLKFKPNVLYGKNNYHSRMQRIFDAIRLSAPENYTPTITSLCDGTHGENSKHYTGYAIDVRIRDISTLYPTDRKYLSNEVTGFANRIQRRLGSDYDVVLEKTHIHIEYDPEIYDKI
jgi:hypothetical protein